MILREIKNMYIKNRLTEGVDFKRYEWLKGDNTAIIEWYANLWNNQLHTVIGKDKKIYIYSKDWSNNTKNLVLNKEGTQLTVIFRSGTDAWSHIADYAQFTSMPDIVDFKFYINNNIAYCERNEELFTGHNMQSYWNDSVRFDIYAGKMKLLEEYDSTNDKLISSLVPCQLLKSIPATLDANNIARNTGECGMYDSISGKFFGNVASTGTFTVEGDVTPETHSGLQQIYQNKLIEGVDYQTYDWLKGDAVAYINTNYLLDFDDIKTSIFRLYNTGNQVFEGSRYGAENNGAGTVVGIVNNNNKTFSSFFSPNGLMAEWNRTIPINTKNTVVMSKNGITLNGTDISSASFVPIVGSRFESVTPYLIFASWINNWQIDNRRDKVDYKSFEIEGKLHLVPCTLLHSIPRNLDAQCKERVAGECGMIDLISGKFYGNIASSGTFTVENDNE